MDEHNRPFLARKKDHLAIGKRPCKIEICTVAIHPGLAPKLTFRVIRGKTHAVQVRRERPLPNYVAVNPVDQYDGFEPRAAGAEPAHRATVDGWLLIEPEDDEPADGAVHAERD